VVFLKSTQKEEILIKKVPETENAWPHIREVAEATLKSLSQDDLDTIAAQEWAVAVAGGLLRFLESNRNTITNPVVLNVLDTYKRVRELRNTNSTRVQVLKQAAAFLNSVLDTGKKSTLSISEYQKVADGLPLLSTYIDYSWKQSTLGNAHAVQYINSIKL
jgi:hypothetical protein